MESMKRIFAKVSVGLVVAGSALVGIAVRATDYTTPSGLITLIKSELVAAFTEILPFVMWALMLILAYGVCLFVYSKIRGMFGGKKGGKRRR